MLAAEMHLSNIRVSKGNNSKIQQWVWELACLTEKKKSQSRKCRQIMEYEMHFAIQYEALKDITTENI